MIKVTYTELDGPSGPTLRLEAAGHAGYAPAGQDIVCIRVLAPAHTMSCPAGAKPACPAASSRQLRPSGPSSSL